MTGNLGARAAVEKKMAQFDLAALLKDAPEGKWIALSPRLKKIVGVGETAKDALAAAKVNGEEKPILGKKPSIEPQV
jgi:hypothetical protein